MTQLIIDHPHIFMTAVILITFAIIVASVVIAYAIYKGMGITLGWKTGLSMIPRKSSSIYLYNVGSHIDKIDRNAKRELRVITSALQVPDLMGHKSYEFIRLRMILPLLIATAENHHTRELADHSIGNYMEDKINHVISYLGGSVKEVTRSIVETLVYAWTRKMAGIVGHACREKIKIYKASLKEADEDVREVLEALIKKNQDYLLYTDDLNTVNGIRTKITRPNALVPDVEREGQ